MHASKSATIHPRTDVTACESTPSREAIGTCCAAAGDVGAETGMALLRASFAALEFCCCIGTELAPASKLGLSISCAGLAAHAKNKHAAIPSIRTNWFLAIYSLPVCAPRCDRWGRHLSVLTGNPDTVCVFPSERIDPVAGLRDVDKVPRDGAIQTVSVCGRAGNIIYITIRSGSGVNVGKHRLRNGI